MLGLWLWLELTLPKTLTLTLDPNPQNGIVEGHPNQIRTVKKDASGCANHWYCYFAFDIGKIEGDNLRHDIAELVDVDPESNTTTKFIMPVLEKTRLLRACEQFYIIFKSMFYIERLHVRMCLYWCIRFIVGK